jgi:hypothetical protein
VAVYVLYRNQHPDEETVENVLEELKEHNIGINKLMDWPTNHCQLAESPTIEGKAIARQTFKILNILYN